MVKRDAATLDLFRDWQPPQVEAQIDPSITRGGTLDVKIARAVSHAMAASGKDRETIAAEMTEYLGGDLAGQRVSKTMLEQYAAPAKRDHRITLERFIALIAVTGCHDLLGFVCGFSGFVAVPARYAEIIRLWQTEEQLAELERQRATLRGRIGGR